MSKTKSALVSQAGVLLFSQLLTSTGSLFRVELCLDCELVALLEDDTGMELLVNNKIVSLDLPVADVYKKIWCAERSEVCRNLTKKSLL